MRLLRLPKQDLGKVMLLSWKFSVILKWIVYKSIVRLMNLYGSEVWCLRENEMDIPGKTWGVMVREFFGVKVDGSDRELRD